MLDELEKIYEDADQDTYLNTSGASRYLNERSSEISRNKPLSLSSDSIREKLTDDGTGLQWTRIKEKGPYLFKKDWLENYLKKEYGNEYAKPSSIKSLEHLSALSRVLSTDSSTLENTKEGPNSMEDPIVIDPATNKHNDHSDENAEEYDSVSGRIKNSPPLLYAGSGIAGFMLAVTLFVMLDLKDANIFSSDSVTLSGLLVDADKKTLIKFINEQSIDSELGQLLRNSVVKQVGPFSMTKQPVRIYLVDPAIFKETHSPLKAISGKLAGVCNTSDIASYKIRVSGQGIFQDPKFSPINADKTFEGMVDFEAVLTAPGACKNEIGIPSIMINREYFDATFSVESAAEPYIEMDVDVAIR